MKRHTWLGFLMLAVCLPAFAVPIHGPGLHEAPIYAEGEPDVPIGSFDVYNTKGDFNLNVRLFDGGEWMIHEVQMYVEPFKPDALFEGVTKKDKVNPSKFPHRLDLDDFEGPQMSAGMAVHFSDLFDGGFKWGEPYKHMRTMAVTVHLDLIKFDEFGEATKHDAWSAGELDVPYTLYGTGFVYEMAHPLVAHFIDSPVGGANVASDTYWGKTDASGGFPYFPGEIALLSIGEFELGEALAAHKISPLDFYPGADIDDPRVANMARLLQSLDADGAPKSGITITAEVEGCLATAMEALGLSDFDFTDGVEIEAIIDGTIIACGETESTSLLKVTTEDAVANLDRSLHTTMYRKNVSRTPDLHSSKSKLNLMGVWFPAKKANGELVDIEYYDENSDLIRTADEAKPVVMVYTDAVEETGAEDIFGGISRDDGATFKKMNLSRAADLSSFTLENGQAYYGMAKKPVFHVKNNNILVAWTSKFCRGGKPVYSLVEGEPYFVDDVWGVSGPQRSVDYTEQGYPEVGEVPYSCVWTARGTVVTQKLINKGGFFADKVVGDIVWFKPERLTSGRRDANQIFMGGADSAGFAIAWQEDPEGLRPGDASGPGPGWGGATTNHKTDIWYSYITMPDFAKVDEDFVSGGDPQHDSNVTGRPKALVPMSLPVRLTDNDSVNTDNLRVELDPDTGYPVVDPDTGKWIPLPNDDAITEEGDADGSHRYGESFCAGFHEKINQQGELKKVCYTSDNVLLDGNTGASRPNVFLQTYTKSDGTKSAWAIMAYEETKGVGSGSTDHVPDEGPYGDEYTPDEGKNVIYHSFDFQKPEKVSPGKIVNYPERDADGNILYVVDEEGERILDWQGLPQLAYENARRPRFVLQGKSAMGDSKTSMLILYKEGMQGHGRSSDIMMQRLVADGPGNPYAPGNIVCEETKVTDCGKVVCVRGAQNMSSVEILEETDSLGDPESDDPYGAVKVVRWGQTAENLNDSSQKNPFDDARAHRGQIRGDFVVMGYSYTPNWAASRNGNDKYDLFVRRSFDGGQTWTTDKEVEHCKTWTQPSGTESPGTKTEECTTYPAGQFEEARNISQLKNNKETVIEPRIVATPGSVKEDGVWTGIAEDKQNKNVFYVSWGTSTNPKKDPVTKEQDLPVPKDLYYTFTQDKGVNYYEREWNVNPDSDGNYAGEVVYRWDYLARGVSEQSEAQLRMTPDGSRFYASWLNEGSDGSDIMFRRITSAKFGANNATTVEE